MNKKIIENLKLKNFSTIQKNVINTEKQVTDDESDSSYKVNSMVKEGNQFYKIQQKHFKKIK